MAGTDLQTIGIILRERQVNGRPPSVETTVFSSSLPRTICEHLKYLREYWGVENELHYTFNVICFEDASRIRKRNGQEINSAIRRLALSILKSDTTIKDNVRSKRLTPG